MREVLSILAGFLATAAVVPYIIDIVKGKTKPNIVSWLTWTILLAIATSAAFVAHEPRSAFLSLGDLVGTGLIVLFGVKYGIAKFTRFDGFSQAAAIVGLILWFFFNSPTVAILAVVVIDFIASIPTLRHAWKNPEEETWQTFFVISIASALTLLSLESFNLASLSFAIYLLLINVAIMFTVIYRRRALKKLTRQA